MDVKVAVRAAGDVGLLTREQKEARGLVPSPILIPGRDPLRWAECRLIAEAGRCENSVDWAVRAAEAAADAGFWGFKVQMLDRWELVSRSAPRYDGPGLQWDGFAGGLGETEWADIRDVCEARGLVFFASCWDEDSVDMALNLGCPILKVGSADITNELLLRYVGGCGVPVILSTGASTLDEVEDALLWLPDSQVALAACTLSYPCALADAHLNRIVALKARFPYQLVGWSDHCAEPWMVGLARKAGAHFVEAHWTVTPGAGGDHGFALHPGNVKDIGGVPESNSDVWGAIELRPCDTELAARRLARRSLATRLPLCKGDRWRLGDLTALRPGTGVQPYEWRRVIGRACLRDYEAGELLDAEEGL